MCDEIELMYAACASGLGAVSPLEAPSLLTALPRITAQRRAR